MRLCYSFEVIEAHEKQRKIRRYGGYMEVVAEVVVSYSPTAANKKVSFQKYQNNKKTHRAERGKNMTNIYDLTNLLRRNKYG